MTRARTTADITTDSAGLPPGSVLQVVSTTKTDTFSASSVAGNGTVSVTGLSASITPTSASSKILVMYSVCASLDRTSRQATIAVFVERNGSEIKSADTAGNRATVNTASSVLSDDVNQITQTSSNFIDEPSSTSSLTYQIKLENLNNSTSGLFVNRTVGDADIANFRPRATSTITLMEIAG